MNKEPLKIGMICGGRSSGRTYAHFLQVYEKAKLKGYDKVEFIFYEPEVIKLQKIIDEAIDLIYSNVVANGEIIDQLRKIEVKRILEILERGKEC